MLKFPIHIIAMRILADSLRIFDVNILRKACLVGHADDGNDALINAYSNEDPDGRVGNLPSASGGNNSQNLRSLSPAVRINNPPVDGMHIKQFRLLRFRFCLSYDSVINSYDSVKNK